MQNGALAQVRPRKAPVKQEFRPLTQEELLAEAAQTEIENTASVQVHTFASPVCLPVLLNEACALMAFLCIAVRLLVLLQRISVMAVA